MVLQNFVRNYRFYWRAIGEERRCCWVEVMKDCWYAGVVSLNRRDHFLAFLATILLFLISTFSTSLPSPFWMAWMMLGLSALKVKKYLPFLTLNLVSLSFFLMKTAAWQHTYFSSLTWLSCQRSFPPSAGSGNPWRSSLPWAIYTKTYHCLWWNYYIN